MPDLNDKQRAFVYHYLQSFNATKAALAAGYSEKTARTQGSALLTKLDIQALISEKLNSVEITAFRVLGELAKIAYADMGDYTTVQPGGQMETHAFEGLEPGATRAIKKVKEVKKTTILDNGSEIIDSRVEVELHDKQRALDLLGKYLGLWSEQPTAIQNTTIEIGLDPLVEAMGISAQSDWTEQDAAEAAPNQADEVRPVLEETETDI